MGEGPPGDPAGIDASHCRCEAGGRGHDNSRDADSEVSATYADRTCATHAQDVYDDHRGEHQEPDEHVRSADAGILADNLGISAVYYAGGALLLLAVLIGWATATTQPPRPPHHA
jgi:hypothetical protein